MPAPLVQVLGDAPIAQALMTVGAAAGYHMVAGVDPLAPGASGLVVASHGRGEDAALRAALDAGVPYIALVASHKRGAAVLDAMSLDDSERARVHTPAGLDIGARTPLHVAVSILAELISLSEARPPAVEVAIDPVCGMEVAVAPTSLSLEHAGRMWYFCAPGCRRAFSAEPQRYGG